jgi:hypothetical protein
MIPVWHWRQGSRSASAGSWDWNRPAALRLRGSLGLRGEPTLSYLTRYLTIAYPLSRRWTEALCIGAEGRFWPHGLLHIVERFGLNGPGVQFTGVI